MHLEVPSPHGFVVWALHVWPLIECALRRWTTVLKLSAKILNSIYCVENICIRRGMI